MASRPTSPIDDLVVTSPRLVDSSDNSGGWYVDHPILKGQTIRGQATKPLPQNEISKQIEFKPKTKRICCSVFSWFSGSKKEPPKTDESSPLKPKQETRFPENKRYSFAGFSDCSGSVVPPPGYGTF